jgi:hypothetical protein
MSATSGKAVIRLSSGSSLYLNDGHGTKVSPEVNAAALTLVPTRQSDVNPWVSEIKADTIPPDPFDVQVQSTGNVFGGQYYAVFSTVDKQSGIDHYEMNVNGTWQTVTSPQVIADQSLASGVEVRAIDKAGNIRMGTYVPATVIPRQTSMADYIVVLIVILLLAAALFARRYLNKKKEIAATNETIDLRS